jgi:hypothetical protein
MDYKLTTMKEISALLDSINDKMHNSKEFTEEEKCMVHTVAVTYWIINTRLDQKTQDLIELMVTEEREKMAINGQARMN